MPFLRISIFLLFAALCAETHAEDRVTALALIDSAEKSYKSGDYETAIKMCTRALDADGTCARAHFQMGQCLEKTNKPREALKAYGSAAAFAKKESDSLLAGKAQDASKRLGPGLEDIRLADQNLISKLQPMADKALAEEFNRVSSFAKFSTSAADMDLTIPLTL